MLDVALLSPNRALVASNGPVGVVVSATTDSGRTWQASDLGAASRGAARVQFAYNAQRVGGLLVTRSTSSNFSLADWYATNDGTSWTRHGAPTGGEVSLGGDGTLWLAGGPARDQLFNSLDGGASWNRVNLPQEFSPGTFALDPPGVRPDGLAALTVTVPTGATTSVTVLTTTDRGSHWTEAGRVQVAATVGSGVTVQNALGTNHVVIAAPNGSEAVAIPVVGGQPRKLAAGGSLKGAAGLSLASDQVGWARVTSTMCGSDKTQCSSNADLLVTRDGGATWQRTVPQ